MRRRSEPRWARPRRPPPAPPPRRSRLASFLARHKVGTACACVATLIASAFLTPLFTHYGEEARDQIVGGRTFTIEADDTVLVPSTEDPYCATGKELVDGPDVSSSSASEARRWCRENDGIPVGVLGVQVHFQVFGDHELSVENATIKIVDRTAPLAGTLIALPPVGGFGTAPRLAVDLDVLNPVLHEAASDKRESYFLNHPLELTSEQSENVVISATTVSSYVEWELEFSVRLDGEHQPIQVVRGISGPFRLTGKSATYQSGYVPDGAGSYVRQNGPVP